MIDPEKSVPAPSPSTADLISDARVIVSQIVRESARAIDNGMGVEGYAIRNPELLRSVAPILFEEFQSLRALADEKLANPPRGLHR